MAKINQYPAKTVPSNNDEFVLHDPASGSTKKMTRGDLIGGAPLPANSVDEQAIANSAVSTAKIANSAVESSKLNISVTTDANGWKVYDFGTFKDYSKHTSYGEIDAGQSSSVTTSNYPVGVTRGEVTNGTAILTYSLWTSDDRAWVTRVRSSIKLNVGEISVGVANLGTSGQWWTGRGHVVIRKQS